MMLSLRGIGLWFPCHLPRGGDGVLQHRATQKFKLQIPGVFLLYILYKMGKNAVGVFMSLFKMEKLH